MTHCIGLARMKVNEQPAVKDAYIARWMRDVATQLNATEGNLISPRWRTLPTSRPRRTRYIGSGVLQRDRDERYTATATTTQDLPFRYQAQWQRTDDASENGDDGMPSNGAFVRSDGPEPAGFTSAGTFIPAAGS